FVRAALATVLVAATAWLVTAAPPVAPRSPAAPASAPTRPVSRPATEPAGNEQDSERQAAGVADLASANDPEALRLPPDTRPSTVPSTGPAVIATRATSGANRRPVPRKQEAPRTPSSPVTDDEIGRAIEKGVD